MIDLDLYSIQDFTTSQYVELLSIAKANYKFIGYLDINLGENFILWRHDCDYSLNRSLRLAQIENEQQVQSTYFLNPHCDFYNLLEKSQSQIIKNILELGHEIGLHFDAAYYNIQTEQELDELVLREANWLNDWFNVMPKVFSFHNPTEFLLSCERDTYGGLLNCYSKTFKSNISYCSDSNGYWRFRRLRDVLESATDPHLQVLTHPNWWQESPMPPRARIFRSVYGRAKYTMNWYDKGLQNCMRDNFAGSASNLIFLKQIDADLYHNYDYLWNRGMFQSLYIELYHLHQMQINQICKLKFLREWNVSLQVVNSLFVNDILTIDRWTLFQLVFNNSLEQICNVSENTCQEYIKVFNQLVNGYSSTSSTKLEEGCIYLCRIIENLANWGQAQDSIQYDGIIMYKLTNNDLDESLKLSEEAIQQFPNIAWNEFCQQIELKKKNRLLNSGS